jgi:hypothetical protein
VNVYFFICPTSLAPRIGLTRKSTLCILFLDTFLKRKTEYEHRGLQKKCIKVSNFTTTTKTYFERIQNLERIRIFSGKFSFL